LGRQRDVGHGYDDLRGKTVVVAAIAICLAVALSILAAPITAEAQQVGKIAQIGYLAPNLAASRHLPEAFRQGLRNLGYVEGRNVVIEYRDAEGTFERLPALAAELVALKVDVIVAGGTPAALAAKQATGTLPIVFAGPGDPVTSALVPALRGRAPMSRGCPLLPRS
jgi:putative tryptophan/tyrosine transport system substrate-binding protein